ncbi:DNA-binding LacI/PurR family transcriptional regulator [Catenulispora sp. GAS73]
MTHQRAIAIIHELHIMVCICGPERVAVVGPRRHRTAGAAPVPLTAVDMPGRAMGQEAVRLLLNEAGVAASTGTRGLC